MKKNVERKIEGIDSISQELCDDFYVNELEKRLETDPLVTNGLLELVTTNDVGLNGVNLLCSQCHAEPVYVICKDGTY